MWLLHQLRIYSIVFVIFVFEDQWDFDPERFTRNQMESPYKSSEKEKYKKLAHKIQILYSVFSNKTWTECPGCIL